MEEIYNFVRCLRIPQDFSLKYCAWRDMIIVPGGVPKCELVSWVSCLDKLAKNV